MLALFEIERAKNKDLEEKLLKNVKMQQEMRHYHKCLFQNMEEQILENQKLKKEKNLSKK